MTNPLHDALVALLRDGGTSILDFAESCALSGAAILALWVRMVGAIRATELEPGKHVVVQAE